MGKNASKTAVKQLQKFYEKLGDHGGVIKVENSDTDAPGCFPLNFEIFHEENGSYSGTIGLIKRINGDILFAPQFDFIMSIHDHLIEEVILTGYESLGCLLVDENDMNCTALDIGKDGLTECKDVLGLKKRFSQFMHTVTEVDPYLESATSFSYDSRGDLTKNS